LERFEIPREETFQCLAVTGAGPLDQMKRRFKVDDT